MTTPARLTERGTMATRTTLRLLDEQLLEVLADIAVNDADPSDVMPPVAGEAGWTAVTRAAFVAHHRARLQGLAGAHRERCYAVSRDATPVGIARLQQVDVDVFEAGVWLARSERGRGIGTAVADLLRVEAKRLGGHLVATTTTRNTAALRILQRVSTELVVDDDCGVHARLAP